MIHPRKDDQGQIVTIKTPDLPSPISSWSDPLAIATAVPDGPMPPGINGIPLAFSSLFPPSNADWGCLAGQTDFEDPPFDTGTLKPAAGAVVVEPDGRLWLVSPTNGFGGYKTTFAKGKTDGRGLRETALKEVFEELGLEVELFRHLIDVTKSTSRTRYYLARRIGGNPADMCWESQSAHLVPLELAKDMLNRSVDHQVIDALIALWGEWVWWFKYPDHHGEKWELAAAGYEPAKRCHWVNLPLPKGRARIELNVCITGRQVENLKLGYIPREMEQKWFAFFEDNTLYEHRSWTGFCISQIHFTETADGLCATYADVNREARQYGVTDDREDCRQIEHRIRQLANMTPQDRGAKPSCAALPDIILVPKNPHGHPRKNTTGKMGHPITLPGPIGELAKKIGGVGILANEVGVSTRTLSRWAKVGITSKMGMKLLVQLCNCHQVNPAGLLNLSTKE